MSQFFIDTNVAPPPLPPTVPTSFVTDVNSPAVPSANVLNEIGGTTTANNANGIRTDGSSGSNTLTIQLTNRATGTVTTSDATPTTLITLALGVTPGVYTFDISIAGFAKAGAGTPAGCGYTIVGSVRTTGASAVLVPFQAVDHFEEAALQAPQPTAVISVSGNNALVTVTGLAGFTIDWNGTLNYIFVS